MGWSNNFNRSCSVCVCCARNEKCLNKCKIAYTRSGNERSVKHIKHSWVLAHGSQDMPNIDLELVADIWLAWGFQVNFMYDPVH